MVKEKPTKRKLPASVVYVFLIAFAVMSAQFGLCVSLLYFSIWHCVSVQVKVTRKIFRVPQSPSNCQ